MNIKQTQRAIIALGLTAVRINGEWRINYNKLAGMSHDREATAYYTEDNEDALHTAQQMTQYNY